MRDATGCLRRAVQSHFDPEQGSPYWLDRERELGIDARSELREVADLRLFGPFDRSALTSRPLWDFVPRSLWSTRHELVLAETGGTTGRPARCVFSQAEFEEAFAAPYLAVSGARGFPRGGAWLFVGPSGPHVIGQAARLLARSHGAMEPFAVDLDPRFARAQTPGSLGDRLYREHILDQAIDIVNREEPDVLFITPPLAQELAGVLSEEQRTRFRGIHLGGMAVTADVYREIRRGFAEAVILPGYGNSMFGLMVEPEASTDARAPSAGADELHFDYFPLPGRLLLEIVEETDDCKELCPVRSGESGRVVLSRLDESFFLPNLVERDRAVRIDASPGARALGLAEVGLRDPHPVVEEQAIRGVY